MATTRRLSNPPPTGVTPDDDLRTMLEKMKASTTQAIKDIEERDRLEEERRRKGFFGRLFN